MTERVSISCNVAFGEPNFRSAARSAHKPTPCGSLTDGDLLRSFRDEAAEWRTCDYRSSQASRVLPEHGSSTRPKQGKGIYVRWNSSSRCRSTQRGPAWGGPQRGSSARRCEPVWPALHRRLRSGPTSQNSESPQYVDRANRRRLAAADQLLCSMSMRRK